MHGHINVKYVWYSSVKVTQIGEKNYICAE